MSHEQKSTNKECQGELSDADLSQASGGKSRDYAVKEGPGIQCENGSEVVLTPNWKKTTTIQSGAGGGTITTPVGNPSLD